MARRYAALLQTPAVPSRLAAIARLEENKIAYLREYATTAPLYDWTGAWRD